MRLTFRSASFVFERTDLIRTIERVGEYLALELSETEQSALFVFPSFEEAFKAFKKIHGRKVERLGISDWLSMSFLPNQLASVEAIKKAIVAQSRRNKSPQPVTETIDVILNSSKDINSESTNLTKQESCVPHSTSAAISKITCKYEIDAFDDDASKAFLLAKRIIGPKGSNMKKIIEECFIDRPFEYDALKLRLRGRGSGFKEGPQNKGRVKITLECNEPLHLCISAKSQIFYDRATKLIEQLLFDVCKAFDTFLLKNDYTEQRYEHTGDRRTATHILKKESSNNHRPVIIFPILKGNESNYQNRGSKENNCTGGNKRKANLSSAGNCAPAKKTKYMNQSSHYGSTYI